MGLGGLSPTQCVCEKGSCINLIEELLRMLKASAFNVQASFTHQYFLYCFPLLCFSTDYMFPPECQKKDEPRHPRLGRPPFWLRVDVLRLIFLKDRGVSGDEP